MGWQRTKEHRTAGQSKTSSLKHMYGSFHEQDDVQMQQQATLPEQATLHQAKNKIQYVVEKIAPRS